ncbi:hypothetical protein [Chitinophaga rhizosphaerae]|uniref:hypothetical protein n=1 Tax=Chitinophaga rhizosphaerae TaxID=1864947 RepID=UPI000F7FFDD6|nr:hypothetical protein [Chitinophaga rhizosphaerae]
MTPLTECGPFIYKCYAAADDTVAVLAYQERNNTAPQILHLKFRQYDLPLSIRLMERLLLTGTMGSRSAASKQLYDTLDTFRRILSVYQENVLLRISEHLTGNENGTSPKEVFGPEFLLQLSNIVSEFLRAIKGFFEFISGCVYKLPGFEKMQPPRGQIPVMESLLEDISAFSNHQKKTLHILDKWRKQQAKQLAQQQRN